MIEKVELYELKVVEVDGEYKQEKRNKKTLPAMITNYSLWYGKEHGLLETSLMDEMHNIIGVYSNTQEPKKGASTKEVEKYGTSIMSKMSEITDESKITKVIFLGLVGANPDLDLEYGDFLKLYHGDLTQQIESYINLVINYTTEENEFKKEFEDKTSTARGKDEKK